MRTGQRHPNFAGADPHQSTDLEQPQANGVDFGLCHLSAFQADPPQGVNEYIGEGAQRQAQLIAP
jgi:hypothetical protein